MCTAIPHASRLFILSPQLLGTRQVGYEIENLAPLSLFLSHVKVTQMFIVYLFPFVL